MNPPDVSAITNITGQIYGYVDRVDPSIEGWAYLGIPLIVECKIDAYRIKTIANLYRRDVAEAGYGDGHSGFSISIPPHLKDGCLHRMDIRIPNAPNFHFAGFPRDVLLGIPSLRFEPLTPRDIRDFGAFWVKHIAYEFGYALKDENRAVQERNVSVVIEDSLGSVIGAWAFEKLIGFCSLEPKPTDSPDNRAAILRIALLSPYRFKGIGRQLFRATLAKGRAMSLERIELSVHPENLVARHLYESHGFVAEKSSTQQNVDSVSNQEIRMVLTLKPSREKSYRS